MIQCTLVLKSLSGDTLVAKMNKSFLATWSNYIVWPNHHLNEPYSAGMVGRNSKALISFFIFLRSGESVVEIIFFGNSDRLLSERGVTKSTVYFFFDLYRCHLQSLLVTGVNCSVASGTPEMYFLKRMSLKQAMRMTLLFRVSVYKVFPSSPFVTYLIRNGSVFFSTRTSWVICSRTSMMADNVICVSET